MDQEGQTNTPHPCIQQKEKQEKSEIPRGNLGSRWQPRMSRTSEQGQSHEDNEKDADQHCISERYFQGCEKLKKN
jgi:hypothetical protein